MLLDVFAVEKKDYPKAEATTEENRVLDDSRSCKCSERFRCGVGDGARGRTICSSASAYWWRHSAVLAARPARSWSAPCGQRAGARTASPPARGCQRTDLIQFGHREPAVQFLLGRRPLL